MKTDPTILLRFLAEARDCAIQMMENGAYIQKELPPLRMPAGLRQRLEQLCANLISTKHDLLHEIVEAREIVDSTPNSPAIAERTERIRRWIVTAITEFHQCIKAARQVVDQGEADGLLCLLLTESASNILHAVPAAPDAKVQPQPEPDEEEDDQDEDTCDPNCYAFHSEDSYPIGQLTDTIRSLSERPDLPTKTAGNLKVFLFAMERLPLVTSGVRMSLALRLDQGGDSDWIEIRMEDDVFTLRRGAWIDGDADTETVFEVTPDDRDGDAFIATSFAESFAACAEDACREIVIEDWSDEPFTAWDLTPDKGRWASLACSFL